MNNGFLITQKMIEFIFLHNISSAEEFVDRLEDLYKYLQGYNLIPDGYDYNSFVDDSKIGWIKACMRNGNCTLSLIRPGTEDIRDD